MKRDHMQAIEEREKQGKTHKMLSTRNLHKKRDHKTKIAKMEKNKNYAYLSKSRMGTL